MQILCETVANQYLMSRGTLRTSPATLHPAPSLLEGPEVPNHLQIMPFLGCPACYQVPNGCKLAQTFSDTLLPAVTVLADHGEGELVPLRERRGPNSRLASRRRGANLVQNGAPVATNE